MTEQTGQTPADVASGLSACFSSLDLHDELAIVKTTLLISGADNPVAAHHRDLTALMPNARTNRILGRGHNVNSVFPEACAEATL